MCVRISIYMYIFIYCISLIDYLLDHQPRRGRRRTDYSHENSSCVSPCLARLRWFVRVCNTRTARAAHRDQPLCVEKSHADSTGTFELKVPTPNGVDIAIKKATRKKAKTTNVF